jgi:CelD/BcsL family acetyltransferase involved in cellulose biosynthesis
MHAPLDATLRAEWRGLSALGAVAGPWRALAERALERNVFYEPAFMTAAAPVFGADAGAVLVWSAAGQLLGLFPSRIGRERGRPFAMAIGWTHPFAPLGTPLVDRDAAEAAIAAWLDRLAGDPAMPGLLLLPLVPEQGPFAAALDAVLAGSGRRSAALGHHRRALLDPGARRDGYLERAVPTRRRKELRRQRRRLEEIAPVTVATAGGSGIDAALQDFLVLEASGWKGIAGTAAVNDPAVHDFFRRAVAALSAEGRARIDRLFLNGRAVAAAVTLVSGDAAWFWKIAYNEGLARFSPGVQLVAELTESLLQEPLPARVDSCATANHPMIDHLWRERLALCDRLIALKPSALPFALACRIETICRAALAAAKSVRSRLRGF